jgi:antitoxin (DNA-binding transcriptional repressor) of toxin-antitoxin stability system
MPGVSACEAKTHLPRLLRAAQRGETVIITRDGKPVASSVRSGAKARRGR